MERAGLLAQGETGGEWRHLAKAGAPRRAAERFCSFFVCFVSFFKEFGAGQRKQWRGMLGTPVAVTPAG